ncbi:MAG: hypothetical protein RIC95_05290 [Vicingaceae bacterium]
MKKRHFILFSFLISLLACQKEDEGEEVEVFFGYQYAPLAVGQERVFQIDSIVFDDFTGLSDTFSLQRREVIEANITTLDGKPAFRTQLFRRSNDTSNWILVKVFEQLRSDIRFEQRIDNFPVIQLVFPLRELSSWNANALNTAQEEVYRYDDLHESFQLDSVSYDSTITVIQREEVNLIQETYTEEKYASGLGMVYRYDEDLNLDIQSGEITSGYKATLKMIGHNLQ